MCTRWPVQKECARLCLVEGVKARWAVLAGTMGPWAAWMAHWVFCHGKVGLLDHFFLPFFSLDLLLWFCHWRSEARVFARSNIQSVGPVVVFLNLILWLCHQVFCHGRVGPLDQLFFLFDLVFCGGKVGPLDQLFFLFDLVFCHGKVGPLDQLFFLFDLVFCHGKVGLLDQLLFSIWFSVLPWQGWSVRPVVVFYLF